MTITTLGDRGGGPLGDKSRWVSELERALLEGEIDVAVHSAKDVPAELAEGLELVAIPARADPRDAICGAPSLAELAPGARVGTSSLRRAAQLRAARDDLEVVELRGNVDTRLRKLAEGECDALVLARRRAGSASGGTAEAGGVLDELVPAAGQGALALEARAGAPTPVVRRPSTIADATACVTAERELDARARRLLQHPRRRARPAARRRRARAHGWVGLARRLGVDARRAQRRLPDAGRRGRGADARRGRRELLRAPSGAGWRDRLPGRAPVPAIPGLLTARALELIAAADVIVYDRLIPARALDGARPDAELIYAGKEGGGPSVPQEEIDAAAGRARAAGRAVVRLKGGDPFVFGRGGEEAEALRAAGIAFEVVPGVTAGVAGAGLRRDPGDPSRRGQRGGVRHRPRGSGQARVRRSTGRRWRRSRARWSSTWACASCRRSPRG